MKAMVMSALANLALHGVPEAAPGSDEVLVRLRAAALNFRDLLILEGKYGSQQKRENLILLSRRSESFNARPENIRTAQKDSGDGRLNDWIEAGKVYKVTEEVVGLGSYGRTLTILTCRNLTMRVEAEDEDGNEEELIESWTPRFRR